MKLRLISGWLPHWLPLLGALIVIGIAFDLVTRSRLSATTGMICEGEYSDTLQVQSVRTRDLEQGARGQYSYLIRSTAKYECPFFGPDGKLRRRRVQASELGTAFAYEVSGSETYLLTNEHVAVWPEVTDALHRIEGVADGCKRVEDKLRIVRDERDDFDPGQIALTRVAVDPLLDAAILKAGQRLTVLPYKVGKSAGLRQGNAVAVRGFPLGVMQAVSSGKVVNPYDRDQEQGWDHVDFVVDALLSEGNSGSPVLAASCKSRELELVGVYHAGYKGHSALNVVVGIDQLTDFMRKKRRVPRAIAAEGSPGAPGLVERGRVKDALAAGTLPLFDFGGLIVRVEINDGVLLYHLYGRQFPLDDRRVAVIEDLLKTGAFGELGRMWVLGRPAGASGRPARSARTSAICSRVSSTRFACRCCTHSTTATRWRIPARPTSAAAAVRCRGPSPATCLWRAICRTACSRPRTGWPPRDARRAPRARRRRPPRPLAASGARHALIADSRRKPRDCRRW